MEEKHQTNPETCKGQKKPYIKPQCVSEPIYETLALACGKLFGQGGFCNAAPKRS